MGASGRKITYPLVAFGIFLATLAFHFGGADITAADPDRSKTTLRFSGEGTEEREKGVSVRFVTEDGGEPANSSRPSKQAKVDPIKANGPIFVDWPKPAATLVFTGEQNGYLEPCGCAGLTNQKGGLKRRHTFLKQLQADGWNPIPLDSGGQIKRFGQQAQIKLRRSLESLIELGYQGVGFGSRDLRMDLLGVIINFDPESNPLTSANVGILGFDDAFSKRYRVVEAGGVKIGFTSVLGAKEMASLGEVGDITLLPPEDALAEVTPLLEAEACDQRVLMVYGDADEASALARQFPAYDWIVAGLGADEPPHESASIEGTNARLIEVGHKGMYAVALGIYPQGEPTLRYQKVPLDHRFEDSTEMQRMLTEYQDELATMGFNDLGLKAMVHPTSQRFAGSEVCGDCHSEAMEVFEKTPHSHATQTLVDLTPSRHFDPECLSCHVTGWNPQKYTPYASGYASLKVTPHLRANGCENCHGPAARHADVENGVLKVTEEEELALRQALHMEIQENEGNKDGQLVNSSTRVVNNCLECHDEDNSPDFDFQAYWPEVAHYGKD